MLLVVPREAINMYHNVEKVWNVGVGVGVTHLWHKPDFYVQEAALQ